MNTALNVTPQALSDKEIAELARSTIRYALFRYRSGTEDSIHLPVINYYVPRLTKYKLDRHNFANGWDLDKSDSRNIVSGHIVVQYNDELNASLFNEDGTLKG